MTSPGSARAPRALVVIGVLILVAAHGGALNWGASRLRLPVVITAGVLALLVAMHWGFGGKIVNVLRDRTRNAKARP